jgi:hypothetical protein
MNIEEMHYDFKQKLNKIDSQQYRNLKVPEIDWKINESIGLFVKIVAEPKYATRLGFETSQRVIDDIRTIVEDAIPLVKAATKGETDVFVLPVNYLYYVGTEELIMESGTCKLPADRIIVRQHDDDFQSSPFDRSSFLWREVNIRFYKNGIRVYNSGEFVTDVLSIDYIRKPASVNNSESYPGGVYKTLGGIPLTSNVNCDLPAHTHREIVDLAVAITTGDLQIPDYQIKKDKLAYNQLT